MIPFRARRMAGADAPPSTLDSRTIALGVVLLVLLGLIAFGRLSMTINVGRTGDSRLGTSGGPTAGPSGGTPGAAPTQAPGATGTTRPGSAAPGAQAASSALPAGGSSAGAGTVGGGGATSGGVSSGVDTPLEETAPTVGPAEGVSGDAAGTGPSSPVQAAAVDPCTTGALAATDQGVTETQIKIGFLSSSGSSASEGTNQQTVEKYKKVAVTWVKELNAQGGICGREVVMAFDSFGVGASTDDQVRACKKLALDEKVFAAFAYVGYETDAGQMCLAKDNKVPLLAFDSMPSARYEEAAGYLWCLCQAKDRMLKNWARAIVEQGILTPQHKVGVIYEGLPYDVPSVEGSFLPELERLGVKPIRTRKLSTDFQQALNEINNAVLEFRTAGVDFVLPVMNLLYKGQFMTTADQQQYYPKYSDSDVKFGAAEFTHTWIAPYPAKSFDRTKVITTGYSGITAENEGVWGNWEQSPFALYADSVYEKWNEGGFEADKPATQFEEDLNLGEHLQRFMNSLIGSEVLLWAEGAKRTGRNITREAWVAEMGRTGRTDKTATAPFFTYGANKWDGPDHIAVIEWHAEASDGYGEREFHQIKPHFPNYY